jgi:hypothetical protein
MLRRAKPVPDPNNPGSFCLTVPGRSPGSTEVSVMPAGAGSSRFCAPKRKMLGAPGLRSTPDTAPTAAGPVGTQHRRTASPKRNSNASDAPIAPRLTNMPHAMSYGLDWPFTRKPREQKPTAFPPSEKSWRSRLDLARGLNQRRVHAVIRVVADSCGAASTVSPCYRGQSSTVRKTVNGPGRRSSLRARSRCEPGAKGTPSVHRPNPLRRTKV